MPNMMLVFIIFEQNISIGESGKGSQDIGCHQALSCVTLYMFYMYYN